MTELSHITKDGRLVKKQNWESYIEKLKKESTVVENPKEKLKQAIINAVKIRLPKEKFGIFFSGGVDSTTLALIAKQQGREFICYTVGLEGSEDIMWANRASHKLKFNLKTKILTIKDMDEIFKKIAKITPRKDVVTMGVGSVVYAVAELAKKDNITTLMSGLGSEEIFAGYQRHKEAKDINNECWNGLKNMYDRDLTRDTALADHLKINILTPLMDPEVIKLAMTIEGSKKIADLQNKVIFREIAEEIGLPKEFAQRKKRAAQYGSKTDKAIQKIARINGFKYKKDYLDSL